MNSSTQVVPGSVICLLCRGVVPCSKENPDKLHQHLMEEHNTFFYRDLLFKLHLLDKALLTAIVEFPVTKTKSVAESVKLLENLMNQNKFVEENDSFVSIESTIVKGLAVNDNAYDDIEGSDRFFKDRDESADYTDLENSHNKSIDDFIKTLPEDISYHSEFDQSSTNNLDETDYIMERINQMDHSMEEDVVPNLDEEEGTKKKFKTQRVTCEVCHKTLSKGSMKNHMRIVHSGVKNYECDVCSDKFESKMEVVRHKAREHPKDRRSKLGRVMSNNSSHDETSRDATSNSSILDDKSRDGADSRMLDENSRDADENSCDGTNSKLIEEISREAPVANTLNVTIPSDSIEEMVDNFDDDSI